MQAPSSRIPPVRAAAVASDLYKPCACLPKQYSATVIPTDINKPFQGAGTGGACVA